MTFSLDRRRALSALAGVALLASAAAPAGAATLAQARELLITGKYKEAESAFRKLGAKGRLGLARVLLETGRYKRALATAKRAARGKQRSAAVAVAAEALRAVGKLKRAIKMLKREVKRNRKAYRARILLGIYYREAGKKALAKAIFDAFYDDYGNDKIDKSSAEQLSYVAQACRFTDNFRDASDTFGDAVKANGRFHEASINWAAISLEKYEAGWSDKHLQRVLKINPHHPDALIGMARTELQRSNNVRKVEGLLKRARKSRPNSIEADVVQARILADNEQNTEAEALLKKALKRNPRHLGALTMLATSHYLRDDTRGFRRIKRKIFKLNKHYDGFYHTVVRLAVRHHRYEESIKLSKEAVKRNTEDYYSMADMGTNYLRIGKDKLGVKWLKKAWSGDKYNVRTYNLLNLFDDVIAKHYTFVRTKHFRLRVHKDEAKLVKRLVEPVIERAYRTYVRKYKFRPKHPITIEFFRNPKHYAVRTVGLPGLSALGVCFGPVITTTSPLLGRFNWGQVLWHELNHVFTIQITRSRVPRWLTEGLADLEPSLINPWWKRENDFDIYKALRSGKLHGLASMNSAFTRARSLREIVVAYYQGSLMAAYLVKRWGMAKVLQALRAYGRSKRTEQILPKITGMPLAQLDAKFRAHEQQRLAHYKNNWYVDFRAYRDLPKYRKAAQAKPNDATAVAGYGIALLLHRKMRAAKIQLQKAVKLDPNNRLAIYASVHAPGTTKAQRVAAYERILKSGVDSYQIRLSLGRMALRNKKLAEAAKHLARAKKLDPERGTPYYLLARAYVSAKKETQAIAELKKLAALQQQSFGPIGQLIKLLAKRKDWTGVRKYGVRAYYISPASVELHLHLATAFLKAAPSRAARRAKWHLETALMTKPSRKSELAQLHAKMAEVYLATGNKAGARKHFDQAKKADPDLPELGKLRSRL